MDNKDCEYIRKWAYRIHFINYLGGKCSRCGLEDIFVLEFHHVDGSSKEFNISSSCGFSRMEKEVEKCVLLCSNCHSELRWGNSRVSDLKINLLQIKGQTRCERCGYSKDGNFASLDFHHRCPQEKKLCLGNAYRFITKDRGKIIEELDKCEVLCGICHFKEHFDFDRFNKFKDRIYEKTKNISVKHRIDENRIFELVKNGFRNHEICNMLSIPKSTLSTALKRLNIKRNKLEQKNKICEECGNVFVPSSKSIRFCGIECKGESERKINISKDDLAIMLESESYSSLARKYNVVPNTIKNLAIRFGLR